MKKVFSALVAAAILSTSVSFAQSQADHEVNVKIPNVLRIRLTSGEGNTAVTSPTPVEFDFVTNEAQFDVGTFDPTNTNPSNWDDVKVFSNNATGFRVNVAIDNFNFDWSKVSVAASGGLATPFTLGSITPIAQSNTKTGGWAGLGFGPDDFDITFDGTEDAGEYSTTVTYSIASL